MLMVLCIGGAVCIIGVRISSSKSQGKWERGREGGREKERKQGLWLINTLTGPVSGILRPFGSVLIWLCSYSPGLQSPMIWSLGIAVLILFCADWNDPLRKHQHSQASPTL
jgi:hypothetical protein